MLNIGFLVGTLTAQPMPAPVQRLLLEQSVDGQVCCPGRRSHVAVHSALDTMILSYDRKHMLGFCTLFLAQSSRNLKFHEWYKCKVYFFKILSPWSSLWHWIPNSLKFSGWQKHLCSSEMTFVGLLGGSWLLKRPSHELQLGSDSPTAIVWREERSWVLNEQFTCVWWSLHKTLQLHGCVCWELLSKRAKEAPLPPYPAYVTLPSGCSSTFFVISFVLGNKSVFPSSGRYTNKLIEFDEKFIEIKL